MAASSSISSSDRLDVSVDDRPWRTALGQSWAALLLTVAILCPVAWYANDRLAGFPPATTSAVLKYRELSEQPGEYDLVILGSSRAHFGVDPTEFAAGGRCFNLALPGAAMRMTRLAVEKFLESGNSARCVLLEVNPRSFDSNKLWRRPCHDTAALGYETASRMQRKLYGDDWRESARFQLETTPLWSRRAPPEWFFFGFDGRRTLTAARGKDTAPRATGSAGALVPIESTPAKPVPPGDFQPADPTDDVTHFAAGHIPLQDRGPDAARLSHKTRKLTTGKNLVCPADVRALEEIVTLLQAQGTTVVLLETPVYRYRTIGEPYEQYLAEIKRIVDKFGLQHLDYRSEVAISQTTSDDSCFFDHTHLSKTGARLFSRELYRDVERTVAAFDPRGRPVNKTAASKDPRADSKSVEAAERHRPISR